MAAPAPTPAPAPATTPTKRSPWPGRIGMALGLVLAIAIVGGVIGSVLPRGYSVESSIVIDAPPSRIFSKVDSLRAWQEWCPWTDANPSLKGIENSYSGPETGKDATWSWKHSSGDGKLWITASTRNRDVVFDMTFADFPVMHSYIQLEEEAGKTKVIWKSEGEVRSGPIDGWFTLIMPSVLKGEYDSGLAKLKTLAEAEEAANPTPAGGRGGMGGGMGGGAGGGFGGPGGGAGAPAAAGAESGAASADAASETTTPESSTTEEGKAPESSESSPENGTAPAASEGSASPPMSQPDNEVFSPKTS